MNPSAWLKATRLRAEHRGRRARPHRIVTRAFHWLTGGVLVYGLLFNAENEVLSDPPALAREIEFALALGCLFLIRLVWVRQMGGGSRLPPEAPRWERGLSGTVHYGIYVLVLAVVLSGLAIALTPLPSPSLFGVEITLLTGNVSQAFLLELHEAFATTLMLLIGLHVLGATWHWVVRKDGVWESMLRGSAAREL